MDLPAIAAGHDNLSGIAHLHWHNPKLFRQYAEYIRTTYQPFESQVLSAARRYKPMGLPTATWVFELLYVEQVTWINETFFPNNERDVLVTIRTLDTERHLWQNYNATFNRPLFQDFWTGSDYREVVFSFFDLREIS
jgi:hypothetical protein